MWACAIPGWFFSSLSSTENIIKGSFHTHGKERKQFLEYIVLKISASLHCRSKAKVAFSKAEIIKSS